MQENEKHILGFVREFVQQTDIGRNKVQLALIQYSMQPTPDFLLKTYSVKEDVLSHLSNVKLKGGLTVNTGVALDYVRNNVFTTSSGSRAQQGVPQILIVLHGRKSEDDVSGPTGRLTDAGIVIFSVGLNNVDPIESVQLQQSHGKEYLIKDMSDFNHVRQQLFSSIQSQKEPARPGLGE